MSGPDRNILDEAARWLEDGRGVALATVVETWGSAPQPVGSQLAIDGEGNFIGSVSGGCVEGAVVSEGLDAIASGSPKVLAFGVADETAWEVGLACGGRIRVHVEPLAKDGRSRDMLDSLLTARRDRRAVALVTELGTGKQRLVGSDEAADDTLAADLAPAFRFDRSGVVASEEGEFFINVYNPPLKLVVIGAVHIAQALIPMAKLAGYDVSVIDPRGAFATPERFPGVTLHTEWPDEVLPVMALDRRTAMIALTHDPKLDDPALSAALASQCFYIGALGSRKTHARRSERLAAAGLAPEAVARIHGPIGLDIGARGPAEIAISIMAEMTRVLRLEH
jgi:xanthine dehydrogenase accessory factor